MNDSPVTIYVAGDSTAQSYTEDQAPLAGWAQMLQEFFKPEIRVENHAIGGRSTKSFIYEGRLDAILDRIKENDYLLIQFGHNDQKLEGNYTDPHGMYKTYLKMFVDGAREKGAIPVLLTPVSRRRFDINGKFVDTHGDYPQAVISLGRELDVPVIDVCTLSKMHFEKLGIQETQKIFLSDNTHFSGEGAHQVAKLAAEGMRDIQLPVCVYLQDDPPTRGN